MTNQLLVRHPSCLFLEEKSREMVFKNIIRYIINRYLKNYIEELDYEKLNFNLISGSFVSFDLEALSIAKLFVFIVGHVSLENLRLKPEALVRTSNQIYFSVLHE